MTLPFVSARFAVAVAFLVSLVTWPSTSRADEFGRGVDVGWLQQMAVSNFQFHDTDGKTKDPDPVNSCLKILKAHGVNMIRLRVFVPPIVHPYWDNQLYGHCTIQEVVPIAVKANALGLRILVSLDYSWTMADPANQRIPVTWTNEIAGMSTADAVNKLASEVSAHTTDVVTQLKAAGVTPEFIAIGNEITNGMLLHVENSITNPSTRTSPNYGSRGPNLAKFINAGYDAVKAIDSSIKVVIHIDRAHNTGLDVGFFDSLKSNGGKWDVSATDVSGGIYSEIQTTVNTLASRFNTPGQGGDGVLMMEIEPPNIYDRNGNYNPQPNIDMVTNILNIMRAIPDGKGLAALYWEAQADPDWRGYLQSTWTNHMPSSALDALAPILKTSGLNIVKENDEPIPLRGVNLGGWLVMEPWMTPADSSGLVDEYSIIQKLDSRFGVSTEQSLMKTYRQNWIGTQDLDNIKAQGLNVVRVPVWWGDFYSLSARDSTTVAINSPTTATGTAGNAFSYAVSATNSPTSFSAAPLPAGLTFNSTTGILSGIPTTAATTSITLQATGAGGTGSQVLSLAIKAAVSGAPVITSASSLSATSTNPKVSYTTTATNTPTAFAASNLPAGLSLNTTSGLISGTLASTASGVYNFSITATNATGSNSSGFSLVVTGTANTALKMRSDAFERLDWLVYEAWKRGIYTIIDMHGVFGGQSKEVPTGHANQNKYWTSTTDQADTRTMWAAIAEHYRGHVGIAGYDLLNEPSDAPNNQAVVTQLASLYTTVRAVDPDHIIFMEGTFGNPWSWASLPKPSSVGWTNVVYELHEYNWSDSSATGVKLGADRQVSDFNNHKSWNVPAYIGEFNAFGSGTPAWQYVVDAFNNAGMSWSTWSYKATHGGGTDSWGLYNPNGTYTLVPNITTDSSGTISSKWSNWNTAKTFSINPMISSVVIGTPTITSLPFSTLQSAAAFSYTITANARPTSFGATGLPGGLSINTATGVISGTPTTKGGIFNISLSALTSGGTCTGNLRLTINPPANYPFITSPLTASGVVGTAFSYTIAARNGPTSYAATGLPAGLSITKTNGVISGKPTAAGQSNVILSATNGTGTITQEILLTVTSTTQQPAPPTVTVPANITTTATGPSGAVITFTTSAVNGVGTAIPTINTPASGSTFPVGSTTVTTKATDSSGQSTSKTFMVVVNPGFLNRASGGMATASSENPPTEGAAEAFDGSTSTKWYGGSTTAWLAYQFGGGSSWVITEYAVSSANDVPTRDPKNWQFQGSNNGTTWTTLDTRTSQSFSARFQTNTYPISNTMAYSRYRLNITSNVSGSGLQLSELGLFAFSPPKSQSLSSFQSQFFTPSQLSDPSISGPGADPDGDGMTNQAEYIMGTDPVDASSVLKFSEMQFAGAGVTLTFPTVSGRGYHVERSTDLKANNWAVVIDTASGQTDASGTIVGDGAPRTITDHSASTPSVFYRIKADY